MDEVRGIGRYVCRLPCPNGHLFSSEGHDAFAFKHAERLLEIVTVRRRATAGRYLHVDETEFAGGVFTRQKHRVDVARERDVLQLRVY